MSVQWGKLAADTLTQGYEPAAEDLQRLRESLDNQSFATPLMQLQQRTWLMHWSLHVFWNTDNGKNALIDLFLQPAYLSAITINAPHLLRYLAAAVVVNRKRRNVLRELTKVISAEAHEYSDPLTQVRRWWWRWRWWCWLGWWRRGCGDALLRRACAVCVHWAVRCCCVVC